MTDTEMWLLVVGTLVPLVIAAVEQARWSIPVRAVVGMVIAAAAGVITTWIVGDVDDTRSFVTGALLTLVTSIATYFGFWKPTGIAPRIEAATSPRVSPTAP